MPSASDRMTAVELGGDLCVINDELAHALLAVVKDGDESEEMRAGAAISLGPVLEQVDMDGFDDPYDDAPVTEDTFGTIKESFRSLYMDAGVPREVRRRILEASVRAPQDWHRGAVRAAYLSDHDDMKLTAVFCMGLIDGFDEQILESLESENPQIHYQAVCAAGNREVGGAWSHVAALCTSPDTDKSLLLAAIDAVAGIRPHEAGKILGPHLDSSDEDIAEAALEALSMAEALTEFDDYDDDDL